MQHAGKQFIINWQSGEPDLGRPKPIRVCIDFEMYSAFSLRRKRGISIDNKIETEYRIGTVVAACRQMQQLFLSYKKGPVI